MPRSTEPYRFSLALPSRFGRLLSAVLLVLPAFACSSPPPPPPTAESLAATSQDADVQSLIDEKRAAALAAPDDKQAWGILGQAFEANGFHAQAITSYEYAIAIGDGEALPWYRIGICQQEQGDLVAAADAFATAAELDPALPSVHWRLGWALLGLGRFAEAEESLTRAAERDTEHSAPLLGLARADLEQGRPAEAAARLEPRLARPGASSYSRFLLANAYRGLGREDDSARLLASLGGTAPSPPEWDDPTTEALSVFRVGYGQRSEEAQDLLKKGRVDRAVPLLEELHRRRPEDVMTSINLAAGYIASGRLDESLELLEGLEASHGDRFNVVMNLAAVHLMAGRADEALEYGERAATIDPSKLRPHELIGIVWLNRGEHRKALEPLTRAVQLAPNSLSSLTALANAQVRSGLWASARDSFARSATLSPNRADLFLGLARSETEIGNTEAARKALDRAEALGLPASGPQRDELEALRTRLP